MPAQVRASERAVPTKLAGPVTGEHAGCQLAPQMEHSCSRRHAVWMPELVECLLAQINGLFHLVKAGKVANASSLPHNLAGQLHVASKGTKGMLRLLWQR